ncbi:MAG: Gfo/Idh/MocA family protein [Bacteroidota bacterium]
MNKIRFGIIGCGRIAHAHLQAIQYLDEQAEIKALSDVSLERMQEFGEKIGVDNYFTDYHVLLNQSNIDAVVICLPHHLHHEATVAAARAGKHILLEKPMALTAQEALEMVQFAQKHKVNLMVGQSRRFSDAVFTIKERLKEIGPVIRIVTNFLVHFPEPPTGWWKSEAESGDLITFLQASHSVDFTLWILGKMPERVYARTFNRNPKGISMKDEEDIILEFPDKISASFHLSLNTQPPVHETLVIGEAGSFRLVEYGLNKPFTFGNRLYLNNQLLMDGEQQPSNYTLQMKEFVAAIQENRLPLASGAEIYNLVKVLESIAQSAKSKQITQLS